MRSFLKTSVHRLAAHDSVELIEDLSFERCTFRSCVLFASMPATRTTVRGVRLLSCEIEGGLIEAAILDDVAVDGLKTVGLLQAWGLAYRHVTFRGKIGRIMLSYNVDLDGTMPARQRAFDVANEEFYRTVDWALDISEAEFQECDISGVPARLIRREIASQAVVTREKALLGTWRRLDLARTYWPEAIEGLLRGGHPDCVLVAPKRARDYKVLLEGIQMLRDAGVAEPD